MNCCDCGFKTCYLVVIELDAGSVGLALTYAVTLMGMFQWGVRQSAEVENMVRYLQHVPKFGFLIA